MTRPDPISFNSQKSQKSQRPYTLDQSATPLLSALQRCADRPSAAFHTPGHKRGQGISARQQQLFGPAAFRADLPELPELDNLFAPEGVILEAQCLAADAFGAEQTWFLANGSTCGIEAAILATCGPGDKLILPRNLHSSAVSGLILSGAVPVYVSPTYSAAWDMPLGVVPEAIATALTAHPDAKAVLVVSPTYYGVCSDLKAIAQLAHQHHIPLIIDEAHGPHFAFHPELPATALSAGADIAVQSAHKVLSAFTQSALLHVQGSRIDRDRLSQSLQLTQSTSPSYLLLGSLDAARHQMATAGVSLMARTLALADQACAALDGLPGLKVLQPATDGDGMVGDRTRLTIDVSDLGITGFTADDRLHNHHSVTAELPARRHLMFIVSLGNTAADITRLITAFKQLSQHPAPPFRRPRSTAGGHAQLLGVAPLPLAAERSQSPLTPRQAFFACKTPLPTSQAIGHICAETICPYPPGIPALLPGEPISATAIAHLQAILKAGGRLTGCRDPSLKTMRVIQP